MSTAEPQAAADDLHFAPLRWWHLDAVVALEQRIFGDTAWSLEQYYGELAAAGRWLRGLFDTGGDVLGYIDVAVAGADADLMTIAVADEVRGTGWGGRLLAAGLGHARDAGAAVMFCEVRSDNPAARLYLRVGFEPIDRRRDYYGRGIDAVVMRCPLPAVDRGGVR